jgi:hypothetical protein
MDERMSGGTMYDDETPANGTTDPNAAGQIGQQTQTEADPVGPFQMSDEDLLRKLDEWFKEAASGMRDIRPKRTKDWQYYASDQWEKEDAKLAEMQRRPALTFNMLLSIISAVEGEERTNRLEMKFYGEGAEDDPAAYGINRLVKWIMDQCGGQFALSKQFRSALICGEGWVVPDVDYFDDPNGKIKLEWVDDEEIYSDPLDTDETAAKARYLHRVKMLAADECEARWPGFKEKVTQACQARDIPTETDASGFRDIYSTPNDTTSPKLYDATRKLWSVKETWWSQIEPGWVVVDEATNLLVEKTDEEFGAMRDQRAAEQAQARQDVLAHLLNPPAPPPPMPGLPASPPPPMPTVPPPLQATQRPIRRIYQAFWAFNTLLDKQASPLPRLKRFPYVPMRGLWDKVKKDWMSIVRPLWDAQKQHNVEQSVIVQLTQLMPKSSWMAPKGAYHDKQSWMTKAALPGAMLEYNAQRGKPEQISSPPISRDLINMAMSRPQSMQNISGVNVDMMGQRVASDPGVVMEKRQQAAKTVLAPLFDNFRATKMVLGKVLLAYIQAYIPVDRRIRVLGPEGASYVTVTEDMTIGDYDLTVDEADETVNDRIATLNILQTTLPAAAKAGIPIPPEFVDLMPMPPHIRNAWKRMFVWHLTTTGQMPPPGWMPGMPVPGPALPPPGAPPGAEPAPPAPPPAAPAQHP